METEERRRSQGSAKTSKKGGKRTKALAAEEEARRREVVTEMLRDKLELEKRALKIVERLLEDSVAEDFLVDCARFITPANYKDALEERSIAKLCSYPLCSNQLGKIPTQKYRISTKTNKVYDITERKCFCSNFCYKASKEFELQIPNTPLWLRQHESPPEIKLMKKRDGGSSGEEIKLLERRLQVDDIEDPLAAPPEDPPSSRQGSATDGLSHSESSDVEQEQDFVSSVVSQRQGPRVHWGDLPKRTDGDRKGDRGMMERRKKQGRVGGEEEIEGQAAKTEGKKREDENRQESLSCKTEVGTDAEKRVTSSNTDGPRGEPVSDQPSVEETTAKLNLCSLSESVTQTAPPPVDSTATQAEHTDLITSPPCDDSNSSTERKPLPSSTLIETNQDGHDTAASSQPGLNITQVGVSKRGAAGLQDLLKSHAAGAKPHSIRLNLLECLRRTLKDWSTDKTLEFLYGAHYSPGSPVADVKEEKEAGEEDKELDEDDLEDDVANEDAEWVGAGVQKRASAAVPDYQALRQETQQLELKVREFYKGTWILPEGAEELHGNQQGTVQDQSTKDPALPLVDSHAQHLIQKRIAVEKLTSCLRNIVSPLSLTISDFSTDLNNLVKTFRFSNTNIIHKTPEWTLIAVVLLHLLSEVSPVVREALETPASTEYLNTLMEELGLKEQDLLNVVRLFKAPAQ
ncbi:putative RNA polymerase II subunit B1 CTD phosphatase rpap2 isoform X1 [Sander lucioperca]|uniref:RNA polymerase II subunit B1 CTD phosphatase RPAP2 homolog n=1 Tax=Sander lucioperca TaxID=283035 RepID=A0A8C9YC24_SANLU|nr:putative RNA polymerase II subunit B1 CTD phosphatase rpap2 isoform X1 [Sander lucioperca]XP_035860812.1 putative RNA polymerase II subunit B1 CTD phosphatase rpap2 isoform X1 [Sander lucioperca]